MNNPVKLVAVMQGNCVLTDCSEEQAKTAITQWQKFCETPRTQPQCITVNSMSFLANYTIGMYYYTPQCNPQEELARAQMEIAKALTKESDRGEGWRGE